MPESQSKHVQVNPQVGPPLMLITYLPMGRSTLECVRQTVRDALESGDFQKVLVIEGFEVFQLIDGRWIHVDASVELEGAPILEPKGKINFREFL